MISPDTSAAPGPELTFAVYHTLELEQTKLSNGSDCLVITKGVICNIQDNGHLSVMCYLLKVNNKFK